MLVRYVIRSMSFWQSCALRLNLEGLPELERQHSFYLLCMLDSALAYVGRLPVAGTGNGFSHGFVEDEIVCSYNNIVIDKRIVS